MPDRLFELAGNFPLYSRLAAAGVTATLATLADASAEVRGWEELGMKGLLIAALVFVVNLLLKQQAEHKTETREREARVLAGQKENTEALRELTALTKEQTDYFKAVTRNVVDERLKEHAPTRLP